MRAALPPDHIVKVRKQLEEQFGTFKSISDIRIEQNRLSGMDSVRAKGYFTVKDGEFNGAIDRDGKIGGFFLKPLLTFKEPAYAIHDKFIERETEIHSGTLDIPATLSIPLSANSNSKQPAPCVVLIHGSGPCDRDETVGAIKVFRDLAWGLASHGIAVLRYEKRTRQFPKLPIKTVNDETVDDAIAAVECLHSNDNIDQSRIFILGHSLGALMAPRIAERENKIAGVIICAGPTRNLADIVVDQITFLDSLKPGFHSKNEISDRLRKTQEDALSIKSLNRTTQNNDSKLYLGAPASWWIDLLDYDPIQTVRQLKRPVLILQGGHDYQVTLEDFKNWQNGLKGIPEVSFKCYPELAHTLTKSIDKPGPQDYDTPTNVSPEVIDDVSAWINGIPSHVEATPK